MYLSLETVYSTLFFPLTQVLGLLDKGFRTTKIPDFPDFIKVNEYAQFLDKITPLEHFTVSFNLTLNN